MFAWMNRDALARTVETGEAVYFPKIPRQSWAQGRGVRPHPEDPRIRIDCDNDVGASSRSSRWAALPVTPGSAAAISRDTSPTAAGAVTDPVLKIQTRRNLQMIDIEVLHRVSETWRTQGPAVPIRPTCPACSTRAPTPSARRSPRRPPKPSWPPRTRICCMGLGSHRRVVPHHDPAAWHFGLSVDDVLAEFRRREGVFRASTKRRPGPPTDENRKHSMQDCLFCRIVRGEIPAAKVYEDEEVLRLHGISSPSVLHALVIPKKSHHLEAHANEDQISRCWADAGGGQPDCCRSREVPTAFRSIITPRRRAGSHASGMHIVGGRSRSGRCFHGSLSGDSNGFLQHFGTG